VVDTVNGLRPDYIVILGDMAHDPAEGGRRLAPLAGLEAKQAVWACLGNHERGVVWYNRDSRPMVCPSVDEWRQIYSELGVRLLVNEATLVGGEGSRAWVVGVDDAYSGYDDLGAALAEAEPRDFCLAITHSPDIVDDPRIADVDLVLAGHTHGGQVRLPIVGVLYAPCREAKARAAGLMAINGTTMYVTRGVGEGLPIRVGCPREITLVTLRARGAR
jgi:predicted MPP superfamily phosphohydrolase